MDGADWLPLTAPHERLRLAEHSQHGRLNEREWRAVTAAASGQPMKCVASELAVSHSTACNLLRSGLHKLGLSSRIDLIKLIFALRAPGTHPSPPADRAQTRAAIAAPRISPPTGLSSAERDVVAGVLDGMSNAGIARMRKTSARTIANQLASIYGKLGISGRLELALICSQLALTSLETTPHASKLAKDDIQPNT